MAKIKKKKRNQERRKILVKHKLDKGKQIKIKVVGIGGGGCSIVAELASRMKKISFVAANTDKKALKTISRKVSTFSFGERITKGWGTGMKPDLGWKAALSDKERIEKLLKGYDLSILIASLGGGTGSGAAPIFAKTSKDLGNVTYGIFTLPFEFEGEKKKEIAKKALRKLKTRLHLFSVIPNERIFRIINKKTPLKEALSTINQKLAESLEGLIEMIYKPGLINIDFADFKTVLGNFNLPSKKEVGKLAYLNTVRMKRKEGTAKELVERVINCPLYPYSIEGAKGILLNIAGEKNLSLAEVLEISNTITSLSDKEARIIFGISQGRKYKGTLETTLLATGLPTRFFSGKRKKIKRVIKTSKKIISPKEKKSKLQKSKAKKVKIKIKKVATPSVEKKEKIKEKIRKNGLQIKKEIEAEEERILAKERFWETPAFLRRKSS